ncbi:MAG: hypothetical protein HY264_11415 [Chloroflexi bacterium]|nr:hypothetical protein [Chloroflexota bacterium]
MTTPSQPPSRRPRRGLRVVHLAAIAALALVVAFPATALAADDGGAWAPSTFSAGDEARLLQLTNEARAAAGLKALKLDSKLVSRARWRSQDMATRNYFSHSIPPDGKKVFDYLTADGFCYATAGENLGTNTFPDDIATDSIQQGFMGSAGHRALILGSGWDVIGIGAYEGADGQHLWTVLFADVSGCGAAPAPTPKPTPKPTVKPAPAPTPKPTPRPTAPPTVPPAPTGAPTPDATLSPTPEPTVSPTATEGPSPDFATQAPTAGPTDHAVGAATGLQVLDRPVPGSLVDKIIGNVAGAYFGN